MCVWTFNQIENKQTILHMQHKETAATLAIGTIFTKAENQGRDGNLIYFFFFFKSSKNKSISDLCFAKYYICIQECMR